MPLQLDVLVALDAPSPASTGQPLLLPLDIIDEDPLQPRTEFDPERLQELAASIAERGVLQAISVRPHPHKPGRWLVNFGARRLRASKLALLAQIPAYVNDRASSYDQVIENEHREGLKPLELALFIQSRIAVGENQAEIARQLGKSQPYITYAMALIDAPDWLMQVYQQGKCRGMAELYQLRRLHAQAADAVLAWIGEQPSISRADIQRLKREIDADGPPSVVAADDAAVRLRDVPKTPSSATPIAAPPVAPSMSDVKRSPTASAQSLPSGATHQRLRATRLLAELDGQTVEIVLDAAPPASGRVFVRVSVSMPKSEVDARDLVLIGFDRADGLNQV